MHDVVAQTKSFISDLTVGDFNAAFRRFDSRMQAEVPSLVLRNTWRAAITKVGRLKQYDQIEVVPGSDYLRVAVTCVFERGVYLMTLWFQGTQIARSETERGLQMARSETERRPLISGMSVKHQDGSEIPTSPVRH